jgi:chromate reductase, NAD(P)H dehydrogenase (quinone)
MAKQVSAAVVIGSLRKESLSRKVATAMIKLSPPSLACRIVEIGDLATYNEDLESEVPAPWARFRAAITPHDAVLFVTPEYNRSMPGGLKNAIDVGSRPSGKNVFNGKAAGVVSVTPYALGGMAANIALRSALIFLNMPTMQMPEAYISQANTLFDEAGEVKVAASHEFFSKFMAAFADWVALIASQKKSDGKN